MLNVALSAIVRASLAEGRLISRYNATPGNLGTDFGRLGMVLWTDLHGYDRRAARWNATVEAMNRARNAIAHDDQRVFADLTAQGWKLSQLATIRRFRGASSSLALAWIRSSGAT